MNRLIRRIRSTLHLDVSPDFDLEHTPAGRSISLRREPPFWARLTSGTSPGPFSFRRVLLKRDGTWADVVARDDKATAYYGGTGPGPATGRRVLLRDVGLGKEYRFFLPRTSGVGTGHLCLPCPIPRRDLTVRTVCTLFDNTLPTADRTLHYRANCLAITATTPHNPAVGAQLGNFVPYWYSDVYDCGDEQAPIEAPFDAPAGPFYYRVILLCGRDGTHGLSETSSTTRVQLRVYVWPTEEAANAAFVLNDETCDTLDLPIEEATGYPVYVFQGGGASPIVGACCSPFHVAFPSLGGWAVWDGTPTTPTSQTLRLTARGLGCPDGTPGPTLAGVNVQASNGLETVSGTTDGSGVVELVVHHGGTYRITAPDSGCPEAAFDLDVFTCDGVLESDFVICCATACLDAIGVPADDVEGSLESPMEDAEVTIDGLGGGVQTTDAEGRVCLTLGPDAMSRLPVPGEDCTVRSATIRIRKDGYLERCAAITFTCGVDAETAAGSPTTVRMYGLKRSDGTDAYNKLPPALADTCPAPDCTLEGWDGLIPVSEDVQTDHDTYAWDDGTSSGTHSLLGGLAGVTTRLNLDTERFDGLTPTTWSPFDPAKPPQRVEHVATHSASFTTRDGTTFGAGGHLWLCGNELIVSFTKPGFDPTAEGVEILNVPSALVEGSGVGTASAIFLHYKPLDFDVCDLTSGATSATQTAAVGDYPRDWTIRWTRGVLPP
jgi:hypothetical protein